MACSYPIKIKNVKYMTGGTNRAKWNTQKYFYVPCGKCIGCMSAKRQWLKMICEDEFNRAGCGGFWTLTYDNNYLAINMLEHKGVMTLDYKDIQDFWKRLRETYKRRYGVRIPFKYVVVGEYGEEKGRIHWHLLTFGIDCRNNLKDVYDAWGKGKVDAGPIKQGGINYVLKYMDKSWNRKKAELVRTGEYDKNEIPQIKISKGLGKEWIEEHRIELIKNNGIYEYKGKKRQIPAYYMNKLNIKTRTDYNPTRKEMWEQGYRGEKGQIERWEEITMTECKLWNLKKAGIKEQQAIRNSRLEGKPQEDFDETYHNGIANEI